MPSIFESKKAKILQQLSVPDAEYNDASPKGSVDEGIRELVDEINVLDTLVTTSSCAGRIAVYLEGKRKGKASAVVEIDSTAADAANAGAGGKGGGQWLFVSHDPLSQEQQKAGELTTLFGMIKGEAISVPADVHDVRWVRCKFEPMILHVLCSSVDSAQRVQSAALGAGFRESGISNISSQADGTTTAMTAIRTTGLAFDSVVGYERPDGQLVPMVDEAYMNVLVQLSNERFAVNRERTERFRKALDEQFGGRKGQKDSDWEPADVRKARLRAEGLARQAKAREQSELAAAEISQPDENTEDAVGFGATLD